MSDIEIATRYLETMSSRDFEMAQRLFAADAEVVAPDGTTSAAEFLQGVREWGGFDSLDLSIEDRVGTEEDGVIVSRSKRVFRWKESGEVAYEQPAEPRVTVEGGRIKRVEMR